MNGQQTTEEHTNNKDPPLSDDVTSHVTTFAVRRLTFDVWCPLPFVLRKTVFCFPSSRGDTLLKHLDVSSFFLCVYFFFPLSFSQCHFPRLRRAVTGINTQRKMDAVPTTTVMMTKAMDDVL